MLQLYKPIKEIELSFDYVEDIGINSKTLDNNRIISNDQGGTILEIAGCTKIRW
jgi:hypothetical protein